VNDWEEDYRIADVERSCVGDILDADRGGGKRWGGMIEVGGGGGEEGRGRRGEERELKKLGEGEGENGKQGWREDEVPKGGS